MSLIFSESFDSSASEMELDTSTSGGYNPTEALSCAIKDWIPEFYIPRQSQEALENHEKNDSDTISGSEEEMECTSNIRIKAKNHVKLKEGRPLSKDDLHFLCDLFYLPFRDGDRAQRMLTNARWLLANTDLVRECDQWSAKEPDEQVRIPLGLCDILNF